jgi:hypothetical protein
MPETLTLDLVALYRQNLDALLRSCAVLGVTAEHYENKGFLSESERLYQTIVNIGSIYQTVTGEDPESFVALLERVMAEVAVAASVSAIVAADKLNA